MTEEKKDQRVKAPVLRARYKSRTLDEFIEKYSRDISRSGMWIKSPKPPALGTLLKVEVLLEDGSPVISAVGRVVKRREESEAGPDNPAGMGIRFLKVEEASQPTIDRIVALKGEDAGPHFDNIRTGHTVPPPSPVAEAHGNFFGAAGHASSALPDSDRTMMRQMNALLGEALRQVNEVAPRRDLPPQKATIMGVAAPAGMLQQAIAAGREEQKKADEGPTKVATRSEIDNALEKLKTVEEDRKPEPVKAEAPKLTAVKSEGSKPTPFKPEDKKQDKNDSDRSASRSVPLRALRAPSVPPTTHPARASSPESSSPTESKTEAASAVKAETSATSTTVNNKATEPTPSLTPSVAKIPEVSKREGTAPSVSTATEQEGKAPGAPEPTAEVKGGVSEGLGATTNAKVEPEAKAEAKPEAAKVESEAKVEAKPEAAKVESEAKAEAKPEAAKVEPEAKAEAKPEAAKVEPEAKAEAKPEAAKVEPEAKAEAKPEAAKVEANKSPEEKKASVPEPEGSAMSLIVAIVVIAVLAFAVYKWLLSA